MESSKKALWVIILLTIILAGIYYLSNTQTQKSPQQAATQNAGTQQQLSQSDDIATIEQELNTTAPVVNLDTELTGIDEEMSAN